MAWAFIAKTQTEWAWIEADSDEFLAWRQYFQLKGWKPFAIKAIEKKTIKGMTMPAQWPEWFDSKYYKPLAAE